MKSYKILTLVFCFSLLLSQVLLYATDNRPENELPTRQVEGGREAGATINGSFSDGLGALGRAAQNRSSSSSLDSRLGASGVLVAGGIGYLTPVEASNSSAIPSLGRINECQAFFASLERDIRSGRRRSRLSHAGFFADIQPFFGYDQVIGFSLGDSPLTPEVLEIVTEEPLSSSQALLQLSRELEWLLDEVDAGRMARSDFEQATRQRADSIRKLAREIRNDRYLGFVEQRKNVKIGIPQRFASRSEIRAAAVQLQNLALELEEALRNISNETRVITIDSLSRPSVMSLSRAVEDLARSMGRSLDRM